jgi:hypothetical protein
MLHDTIIQVSTICICITVETSNPLSMVSSQDSNYKHPISNMKDMDINEVIICMEQTSSSSLLEESRI